jgi:hypothetical protein
MGNKQTAGNGGVKTPRSPGRPKGSPNKVTVEAREVFRKLIESNAEKMQGWLDVVSEKDPGKALSLMATLSEFVVPKLARSEVSGPNGDPIAVEHSAKSSLIEEILSQVEPQDDPKPAKPTEERRR